MCVCVSGKERERMKKCLSSFIAFSSLCVSRAASVLQLSSLDPSAAHFKLCV